MCWGALDWQESGWVAMISVADTRVRARLRLVIPLYAIASCN
jgi:hypothetical protein